MLRNWSSTRTSSEALEIDMTTGEAVAVETEETKK